MRLIGFCNSGKDRFCVVQFTTQYHVEYWKKTRRKNDPFDRYTIAHISPRRILFMSPKRLPSLGFVRAKIQPHKKELRNLVLIDQVIST